MSHRTSRNSGVGVPQNFSDGVGRDGISGLAGEVELLFAGQGDVLSAPWFLVLVFFFVARAEFQVAVLALNRDSMINVLGRGFPFTY